VIAAEEAASVELLKLQAVQGVLAAGNAIVQHVSAFKTGIQANEDTCLTRAVQALNVDVLKKLLATLTASNHEDSKVKALASALFSNDCEVLKQLRSATEVARGSIDSIVALGVFSEFAGENGRVEWKRLEKVVNQTMIDKAFQAGVAHAGQA